MALLTYTKFILSYANSFPVISLSSYNHSGDAIWIGLLLFLWSNSNRSLICINVCLGLASWYAIVVIDSYIWLIVVLLYDDKILASSNQTKLIIFERPIYSGICYVLTKWPHLVGKWAPHDPLLLFLPPIRGVKKTRPKFHLPADFLMSWFLANCMVRSNGFGRRINP